MDKPSIDLMFIATDTIDLEVLLDDEKLFTVFLSADTLPFEVAVIDNLGNLKSMLALLFKTEVDLNELTSKGEKHIYDLTKYKNSIISKEHLDIHYQEWLDISSRINTMDEYGNLLGIIGYVGNRRHKKNLILLTEKR